MEMAARVCCCVLLAVLTVSLLGCATVPKEVVELSYTVGQDLEALHLSYRTLMEVHFDGLRAQPVDFLEKRWIPAFLQDFMQSGQLIQIARGSDSMQVQEDVQAWVEVAIETIEEKKRELLDPIDKDEKELLESVDEAFARVIRANATITAHLNSIRKVQEIRDDALRALNLNELRDRIDEGLASASQKAEAALEKFKELEGLTE